MSWLARSLVNSLKVDDDDDDDDDGDRINSRNIESSKDQQQQQIDSSEIPNRGVKEDLSDFTKTISRQLWGVASFLAPPPPSTPSNHSSEPLQDSPTSPSHQISSTDPSISDSNHWESSDQSPSGETLTSESAKIEGIRSDFAEIGGKFRTGISKLSNNKALTEISKIASTFLPFGSEEDAVGVTDEVLAFARNISMHPETWLDFPLADIEDLDDFDMSDAQQDHALAVERLAPRLAALRIELCPTHMSEGCFWRIYFVLLHSRLTKHDAQLLSTPQVVEARAMWMQELQNQTKPKSDISHPRERANSPVQEDYVSAPVDTFSETISSKPLISVEPKTPLVVTDIETEKHPIVSSDMQIIDKSVTEERPPIQSKNQDISASSSSSSSKIQDQKYEEDGDEWLKEEHEEIGGTAIPIGNDEDVSFSDLEEEDYESVHGSNSSTKDI